MKGSSFSPLPSPPRVGFSFPGSKFRLVSGREKKGRETEEAQMGLPLLRPPPLSSEASPPFGPFAPCCNNTGRVFCSFPFGDLFSVVSIAPLGEGRAGVRTECSCIKSRENASYSNGFPYLCYRTYLHVAIHCSLTSPR